MPQRILASACLLLLLCLAALPAQAAEEKAQGIHKALLDLFASPDEQTRLGAMMLSVFLLENDEITASIRASRSAQDNVIARTVKNYALAHWEFDGNSERLRFINEFPEEPADFVRVLRFDSDFTPTVSGYMIIALMDLSDCRNPKEVRTAAREKMARLESTQDKAGWAAEIFPQALEECIDF